MRLNPILAALLLPFVATAQTDLQPFTVTSEKLPFVASTLTAEDILKTNNGQDIPYLLNSEPSVVVTSDAGAGIGYTGIRIRGTDLTRINVTMNGVPVNDSESHTVYWVNMPDLASSCSKITVQRGVGTSTNGAGAFGANIALNTLSDKTTAYATISGGMGSFNTNRQSLAFGTGNIGKFSFDGRVSRIASDGFIDRASSRLSAFQGTGTYRIDGRNKLRFNLLHGNERTYQAWYGVPLDSLKTNRTYNLAGMEKADEPYKDQVDNYQQTHYQLFYDHIFSPKANLNFTGHFTKGKGYYEEYKAEEMLTDYALPDTITTDLVRQRWLDNDFGGVLTQLNLKPNEKMLINAGGGVNQYYGKHFGNLLWAETAPFPKDYTYYNNFGLKNDANVYTKMSWDVAENWNVYADAQYRYVSYRFKGLDQTLKPTDRVEQLHFFNPKAGVSYRNINTGLVYVSFAVANKEPNRSDYIDASPNSQPTHETLYDTELGWRKTSAKGAFSVNSYFMYYKNQLALTGKINDVGAYTRVNIPESYRAGVEMEARMQLLKSLVVEGNMTLSQNKMTEWTEYIDNWDDYSQVAVQHKNTDLAFAPAVIAKLQLSYALLSDDKRYPNHQLELNTQGEYIGKQYIDNTGNEEAILNPYFLQNVGLHYTFTTKQTGLGLKNVHLLASVKNIWGNEYEANAWIYRYQTGGNTYQDTGWFPQAGRTYWLTLTTEF